MTIMPSGRVRLCNDEHPQNDRLLIVSILLLKFIDLRFLQPVNATPPIDSTVDDETYIKAIWETKGREYGLKLINSAWLDNTSTSTYTAPVSEIPSGYSYVTIFHFADGTGVMSEVKQK